jgi:hypothetical protein
MKPAMSICLIVFLVSAAAARQTSADSLYKRLGGCDAITAVTDDFIGRLGTDPLSPGSLPVTAPTPNSASVK